MVHSTDELHERVLSMMDGNAPKDRLDQSLYAEVQAIMKDGGYVAFPSDLPDLSLVGGYDEKMSGCCEDCDKRRERQGVNHKRWGERSDRGEKKYNRFARDADLDGQIQDGTPWQRRSRTFSHATIGKRKKPAVRTRLRDFPYPYVDENLPAPGATVAPIEARRRSRSRRGKL